MSISIDDLVSSLSTSHIGQEALDLAALQAQLAQTLAQAIQQSSNGQIAQCSNRAYTCNTPTAHTPSTTFSFADAQRYFEPMTRRNGYADEYPSAREQMEEDERMVEDLLLPQAPVSANGASIFDQQNHYHSSPHPHHYKTYTSPFAAEAPPNSTFTTTDPFYQQALKSHGFNAAPPSVFTHSGCPSHHSPFLSAQKQK